MNSQMPTWWSRPLTNANFSGAISPKGHRLFSGNTGFTASQLYSTASYASGDLTGIGLHGNDLTGWNFANQNLTNANLGSSNQITALPRP